MSITSVKFCRMKRELFRQYALMDTTASMVHSILALDEIGTEGCG